MLVLGASCAASTSSSDLLFAAWLGVAAVVGDGADQGQRGFGAEEVGGAGDGDQLGAGVDEAVEVVEVEFAAAMVEARQPDLDPPAEAGQDLPAQRVPGDVVGVVLHHRGDHVVAVAERGQLRVHHCVDRFGGVAVGDDGAPAGCVDPGGDGVEGLLEQRGHVLGGARLPPVHVLIPRRQGTIELQDLAGRLRARRVIGHDTAGAREVEMLPYPRHIQHRRRRGRSRRATASIHISNPLGTGLRRPRLIRDSARRVCVSSGARQ